MFRVVGLWTVISAFRGHPVTTVAWNAVRKNTNYEHFEVQNLTGCLACRNFISILYNCYHLSGLSASTVVSI